MQPMSDQKTSPNSAELVAFQDRLAVVGNASFICFVMAVIWTALFIGKAQFSLSMLIVLAAPLIATGVTVLVGALFRDLVPKRVLSVPLNFTIPIIWCMVAYLAVLLISTQETGSTRVPDPLLPAMVWSKLSNLIPVLIGQIGALSLGAVFTKDQP